MRLFTPRTFYDVLDGIRLRPGLYFGGESLEKLSGFLDGYLFAGDAHGFVLEPESPDFGHFLNWLLDELSLSLSAKSWPQLIADHVGGDGYDAMHAFFAFLDRYRGTQLTTIVAQQLEPPRSRADGAGAVRRIEVVERSPDGAWFVWLSSDTGTGCEGMGQGRAALLEHLAAIFGADLDIDLPA